MLLDALKDIDAAQPEPLQSNLIQEYKDILEKENEIQTQLKQRPFYLERLQSIFLSQNLVPIILNFDYMKAYNFMFQVQY